MTDPIRGGRGLAFLADGGEVGALMRVRDWSASPLGAPEDWPQSLRSVVGLLLASKFPMFVAWGADLGFLYNDAYAEILGAKHPDALGRPFREIWGEIWPDISPLIDAALDGRATYHEDLPLVMNRRGFDEETWFTFRYSPVRDESDRVAGMFCSVAETTARVLSERHSASERDRLARMFEQAPGFMAMLRGPEHVFELANAAYLQLVGHRPVVGQRVRDALPEIEGQGYFELLDRVYQTGEPFVGRAMPADLQRSPGSPVERRFVDLIYQPVTDEAGAVSGIFVEGSDVTDRVQSEAALLEGAAELRLLTDTLPVLVSYIDADRRYRFANLIYESWLPHRRDEIVGRPVREVLGEAAYAAVAPHIDAALRGERVTFQQFMPYEGAPGRQVEVEYIPRRTPGGQTEGFYALVQDVTQRRATEEALRRSEAQFRAFTQAVPNHVWAARADGTLYWFNDQVYSYTGSAAGSLDGPDWLRALHPDDRSIAWAAWSDAVTQGRPYVAEFRIRRADGHHRWFLSRAEPVRDRDGVITGWVGTNTDIHDRSVAEDALRDMNETLEQKVAEALAERQVLADFIESTGTSILAFDRDYRILAINRTNAAEIERLYGRRPRVGDNLLELMADFPEHRAQVARHWDRALAGEEFSTVETFGGEAQERAAFEVRYNVLRDRKGRQTGALQTAIDVSDRVRAQAELEVAQEALRQSQKMEAMGSLTGGVAHDFNNLLTPIVAVLDRLRRQGVGGERQQKLIEGAAQSAERARVLVQRLLAFARRQPLQAVAVDVGALVHGMADLVASTAGPQIRVVVDVAPDLPPAKADPNQVEMAILNLAVNARDAMPDGGTLRLGAMAQEVQSRDASPLKLRPGRYLRLSVGDTGTGMDEATVERAVEPFFSTKGIGKGTGLGLSMVHGLAAQLGGALEIRSRPGLGTNVELWLPESREAPDATAPSPSSALPAIRGTALLVDDEAAVRLSTADMLGELGFAVIEAASAEEASDLLDQGAKVDLVITDHLMPGLSGTELARWLRATRPELPLLVISGYAETEGIEPDLPRLTKPFRKDELVAALAGALGDERA